MKCIGTVWLCLFFNLSNYSALSQKHPSVEILQDSIKSSFRGLSVPSDNIIWVSGSNGTVGRSTDAGKSWKWMIIPGFEKRDFRDIEAFDSLTAIIMAVDNPADILKTTDGGKDWKVVFHKQKEGMFLDAMDFNGTSGICIGDPVHYTSDTTKSNFVLLRSFDKGGTWGWDPSPPEQQNNEAVFAGSGTNIFFLNRKEASAAFITGGSSPRLVILRDRSTANYATIPISGGVSAGAFSIATDRVSSFYITGGDYLQYWKDSGNVVYTNDLGKTWNRSSVHGYRSCIIQADKTFITCGTNGVDISFDGCKTWTLIHGDGAKGTDGFNVCAKSKTGKAVYFAGSGRIGKLIP
jgi:hypothetical protein